MRAARSTASRNLAACGRPVSLFLTSHEYMNKTSNFLALLCALALPTGQAGAAAPIPHLVQKDGRHALIVDGKPYTMLAVQAHNSSNYPAALPEVWAGVCFGSPWMKSSMRTADTLATGRPVAIATVGMPISSSCFKADFESHSGGGTRMPSAPLEISLAIALRWLRKSSQRSRISCAADAQGHGVVGFLAVGVEVA
eukprot:gene25987-29354_t